MALGAQVALKNTIPAVVLAGNPVPLKFEASTNLIDNAGSKSEIVLLWTAVALPDEYFDLLLAGETVRFTCKASPDNSGIQFHDNTGSLTLANWVALVASDLEKNYLIARYYDITLDGAEMTITAREEGSAYSQEFTAGSGIDVTPTETNKAGVDFALEAFYYIVVILYCNDEYVTEILLNVDADGLAEVDISKYLQAYITGEFTWPEKPSTADRIREHTSMTAEWYFLYGERWGDGEYQALQESSVYIAINGGLSFRQLALYNAASTTYWAKLLTNKYFLSWAPLTRYVGPDEPVKLYFINHSGAATLRLYIKSYFADGTDSTAYIDSQTSVVDKTIYEVMLCPKAFIPSWATLLKYDAWIANTTPTVLSEVRTFFIDNTEYSQNRYFIFRNSLGAYECIRTTGLMSRSEDYSRETATQTLETDFTNVDREEVDVLTTERRRFIVSCGWLSRYGNAEEFRNWLRDFALSKEVYYADVTYDDSGTQLTQTLVPVRLLSTSLDHGKDRDNLRSFSFEFVNAFSDEFFSKEITSNLVGETFEDDFEVVQ